MAKNRKATEKEWLKLATEITGSDVSSNIWKTRFKEMTDAQFDKWIKEIGSGDSELALWAPGGGLTKFDNRKNMALGKKLGHSFFQHYTMYDKDGVGVRSAIPVMFVELPVRRVSQMVDTKIYVPEDDRRVDHLTGQPTKVSSGTSISSPEMQVLTSLGLEATGKELMKTRGGDQGMYDAMTASLSANGRFSQAEIAPFATGVKSSKAVKAFLTGVHIASHKGD